jgi:hypothetical protein
MSLVFATFAISPETFHKNNNSKMKIFHALTQKWIEKDIHTSKDFLKLKFFSKINK